MANVLYILFSILVYSDFNKHFGEFTVDETHCLNVVMYVYIYTYIYTETTKHSLNVVMCTYISDVWCGHS